MQCRIGMYFRFFSSFFPALERQRRQKLKDKNEQMIRHKSLKSNVCMQRITKPMVCQMQRQQMGKESKINPRTPSSVVPPGLSFFVVYGRIIMKKFRDKKVKNPCKCKCEMQEKIVKKERFSGHDLCKTPSICLSQPQYCVVNESLID